MQCEAIPETIFEVKGGCNSTLEWTHSQSEAVAQYQKSRQCSLYRISTATGVKILLKRK